MPMRATRPWITSRQDTIHTDRHPELPSQHEQSSHTRLGAHAPSIQHRHASKIGAFYRLIPSPDRVFLNNCSVPDAASRRPAEIWLLPRTARALACHGGALACRGGALVGRDRALVQARPDLLRRVRPPAALRPGDHHPGRRDTRKASQADQLPQTHAHTIRAVPGTPIDLDAAIDLTRTGDLWLFRGQSAVDRAIRVTTNSPVNHVGMAVVLDDMPPLMWHAELGRSLPDLWAGKHHRGVQLHDLRAAYTLWAVKYGQRAWLRQLDPPATRDMEDAVLRTIARLDGTPFPSTAQLGWRWLRGRVPAQLSQPSALR